MVVSISVLPNQISYLEKSILKCVDSVIGTYNLKFEICYTILHQAILFLNSTFYFAIKSIRTSFILPLMNDFAAMHCNADLRCYAVINSDSR